MFLSRTTLHDPIWWIQTMRHFAICALVFLLAGPLLAQDQTTSDPKIESKRQDLFTASVDYSKRYSGHAVLIQHRGKLVFERYDDWGQETPHMLASGTKSFSGVLAMFAVQDGLLTLDERVCDTITEWKEDPKKSKITIRHLLSLSSGLEPADAAFPIRNAGLLPKNSILSQRQQRIARQDQSQGLSKLATGNWFKDAVEVPMKYQPGENFDYGPSHFYAFGELLNRKLQSQSAIQATSFEAYAKLRIFDPIGIQIGRWGKDSAGNVNIPGGLMLTARNWAKFGQFVLQQGSIEQADGSTKELLSKDLLKQCFVPSSANPKYGLTWWLNSVDEQADSGRNPGPAQGNFRDRIRQQALNREADVGTDSNQEPMEVYMAAGLGKQRLFILPKYDLVVVRFAEPSQQGNRFNNGEFLKPIVQAFDSEKP